MSSSMTGGNWIFHSSPHLQDRDPCPQRRSERLRELAHTRQPTIARAVQRLRVHSEETIYRMVLADPTLDIGTNPAGRNVVIPYEESAR